MVPFCCFGRAGVCGPGPHPPIPLLPAAVHILYSIACARGAGRASRLDLHAADPTFCAPRVPRGPCRPLHGLRARVCVCVTFCVRSVRVRARLFC